MIKTRAKANLIRGLADNEGLATQLATYQTRYGDWRELFRSVDRIDKVTKADIRRVANETFNDTNRTVGVIETVPAGRRTISGAGEQASGGTGRRTGSGRCAMKPKADCSCDFLLGHNRRASMSIPQAAAQATNWQQIPDPSAARLSSAAAQAH